MKTTKPKKRKNYIFIIPVNDKYGYTATREQVIPAYTKKQAIAYFKIKHGKMYYSNIIIKK